MKKCHPIRTLGHRLRSLFPTADRRVARAGIVEALEPRIAPATFMVTTVADSGDGSLRKAILDANAMPNLGGPDQIQFFIPGTGVKTIAPTTALPPISDAVVVDGYTQPGAARNTNGPGLGDNAVLRIELNGAGAGASVAGLTFGTNSGGSRVSGLAINRFGGDGILLQSGGNTIEGNFIGIDLTGTQALGNDVGVRIDNAINNTIGGTVAGARNVISDNSEGVEITGSAAAGNIVQGNFIGTDASGTVGIPNFIGVAVTSNAHDNTIGGTTSGAGNVIAFNNGPGVNVVLGTGNAIRGNSIHSNGDPRVGLGINLGRDGMTPNDTGDPDSGANNLQNFPVITNVMLATGDVTGTINSTPSTALTLDFYSNPEDRNQGRVFLGSLPVTTDASGNRSYIFRSQTAIAPGSYVSATATDAGGNTSEFSAQFPGPVIVWDAGGGADTSWFNAANWAPNGVPTASDSILLNTNAMITLSGTNVTVANFTQTDGTFTGSATLTVTGTFAFGKGTLGGTGMTVVGAGGTFAFNDLGATDAKTLDARTLSILGTGTVAGSDDLTMNNGARLLIGGSFATGTQFDFLHAAGANALVRINPGASLTVNDSTDIAPGVVFDGQGPITFPNPSGALNIQGGGSFIGGTITLTGLQTNLRLQSDFTFGANTTFSGAGTLDTVSGTTTVTSGVTLTGTSTAVYRLEGGTLTGGGAIASAGRMEWTGGTLRNLTATFNGAPSSVAGSSALTLDNATLNFGGGVIDTAAGLVLQTGATINIDADYLIRSGHDFTAGTGGGFLKVLAGGTLRNNVSTDVNIIGAGVVLTNNGTVSAATGNFDLQGGSNGTGGTWSAVSGTKILFSTGTHTLAGTTTFAGSAGGEIQVLSGAVVTPNGPANLTGSAILRMNGGTLNTVAALTIGASATLAIDGGTLGGAGSVVGNGALNWTGGTLSPTGGTTVNAGGSATFGPGAAGSKTLSSDFANAGISSATGPLTITNGATFTNSGTLDFQADTTWIRTGGPAFVNSGTLLKSGGAGDMTFAAPLAVTNTGAVEARSGRFNFAGGYTQTAGTTFLNGGSISGGIFQGGVLTGTGAIAGNVENTGATVRPGGTGVAGTLTVGSYTQRTGGTLAVDIGGTTAGTQYDVLNITGTATLGGTLNIAHSNGFTPTSGQSFRVVQSAGNPGTFATLTGATAGKSQAPDAAGLVLVQGGITYVWDAGAGVDTSWFNPLNWDRDNGAPGAGDTAILNTNATINLPSSTSVGAFQQSNGTFTSPTAVTFTVLNSFDWSGGTMSGAGTAATTLAAGSASTLSGAALKTLAGRALNVGGTLAWSGAGNFALNSGTMTVQNTGIFDIQNDALLGDADGNATVAALVVAGTLKKSAGAGTSALGGNLGSGNGLVPVTVNASGIVRVQSGTMQFSGGFANAGAADATTHTLNLANTVGNDTSSGLFNADAGGVVRVSVGTQTLTSGAAITGAGRFEITNNGRLDVAANVSATNLLLDGLGLIGTGALTITQSLDWTGSTMTGSGTTTIAAGATLTLDNGTLGLSRTLNIAGAATWIGGGGIALSNGANFNIQSGGNFVVDNAAAVTNPGGGTVAINNAGTFRKTPVSGGGTTTLSANVPFTNTGTLISELGPIAFNGGFTQTAGTTQLNGGTLSTAGTLNFNGGVLIGAGTITGNVNNNGATVQPGGSGAAGTLAITGNYMQSIGGTLETELAGTDAGQFDRLTFDAGTLAGMLTAPLLGGFTPPTNSQFQVLTAATSLSGAFTRPPANVGIQYNARNVTLLGPVVQTEVTTTLDVVNPSDGVTSLREAIISANSDPDLTRITFKIPGAGVQRIVLASALPAITRAVIIDGYTQPGSSANTLGIGDNATLLIELNGNGGNFNGLTITGGGSTVKGLVVNGFGDAGIRMSGTGGNTISGNFIGTNATGTAALGNVSYGVFIGSSANQIGGTNPGDRNLISGNSADGIGIVDFGGASATANLVQGNYIGLDVTGTVAVPNARSGIEISGTGANTIGGIAAGAGNAIAFNGSDGVRIASGAGNAIRGNSIFSNTVLGIALGANGAPANDVLDPDTGANNLQNFPLIVSATRPTGSNGLITGTINSNANTMLTLDFYSNAVNSNQGRVFLGSANVTTNASGDASYDFTSPIAIAPGSYVSGTATDAGNNTSEFSPAVMLVPTVIIADQRFAEGNSGTTQAMFTLKLSNPSSQPITVQYATADGTADDAAKAPEDYTAVAFRTLTFAPGEDSQTIVIPIRGDEDMEQNEKFFLDFSGATNAALPPETRAQITIVNDDLVVVRNPGGGSHVDLTDPDGDQVVVSTDQGTFIKDKFIFAPDGTLAMIDLEGNASFRGANVTIRAEQAGGGDGRVKLGMLNSAHMDLGTVTVEGTLGQIMVGDANTRTPALKKLSVGSLGTDEAGQEPSMVVGSVGTLIVLGDVSNVALAVGGNVGSVTVAGNVSNVAVDVRGAVGQIAVSGDMQNSMVDVVGRLGRVVIGGDLIGEGEGGSSANVPLSTLTAKSMVTVRIVGSVSGSLIKATSAIGSVSIGGDLTGNGPVVRSIASLAKFGSAAALGVGGGVPEGVFAGGIDTFTLDGNIRGAAVEVAGKIGSVQIKGNATNGAVIAAARIPVVRVFKNISSDDADNPVIVAVVMAIDKLIVGGDVENAEILLGYQSKLDSDGERTLLPRKVNASVGSVVIRGNWADSSLVAVKLGTVSITGDVSGGLVGARTIGTVLVGGDLSGAKIAVAGTIHRVKVGGDVENTEIRLGYGFDPGNLRTLLPRNPDASIGSVRVEGNWTASSLVAGVLDATGDGFGQNDTLIVGDRTRNLAASIARIVILGTATGSAAAGDHFGITAQSIGSLAINGKVVPLTPGIDNIPLDEENRDFRLVEV